MSDSLTGVCMYLCVCFYTMHVCACLCMFVHVCACLCMFVHVCACLCMFVHVCACLCMRVFVYVYTSVWYMCTDILHKPKKLCNQIDSLRRVLVFLVQHKAAVISTLSGPFIP